MNQEKLMIALASALTVALIVWGFDGEGYIHKIALMLSGYFGALACQHITKE